MLSTTTIAMIQVTAIMFSLLVAAVGAHDRAVRAAARTQYRLLAATGRTHPIAVGLDFAA